MENNRNFKCTNCEHEMFIPKYSISFSGDKQILKANGAAITCEKCKGVNIQLIDRNTPTTLYFAKFRAMSIEDKRKVLKARAKKHTETTAKEHIENIKRNYTGQNIEKMT